MNERERKRERERERERESEREREREREREKERKNITNLSLKNPHWLSFALSLRTKSLRRPARASMIYLPTALSCLFPRFSARLAPEKINDQ